MWVPNYELALRADKFTARRQETLRRLIGTSSFNQSIAPRLSRTLDVELSSHVLDTDDDGMERDPSTLAALRAQAAATPTVNVYSDLTLQMFANAEPLRLHPTRDHARSRSTEWLRGCCSFMVQPRCIGLASAATVLLCPGLPGVHSDCLYRLLRRIPALERLTLECAPSAAQRPVAAGVAGVEVGDRPYRVAAPSSTQHR